MKLVLLGLAVLCATPSLAFTPSKYQSRPGRVSTWELNEVIQGAEVQSETIDAGQGGVSLAEESAIKIKGDVKHKPGKADAAPEELLRYTKLTSVSEGQAQEVLKKTGSKIICTGQGKEFYRDPELTVEKFVQYAPLEAIKDAFAGAAPAIDCDKLVFNFLGGDDLMMGEVLQATNELVVMLDINTKAKISFNSLCIASVPEGTCAVTVVSVGEDGDDFSGADKSIAAGEVYVQDGKWWTVDETDINTAIE